MVESVDGASSAAMQRFNGFADQYDANRPTPPRVLGPVVAAYAGASRPVVVDLGSGSGLSSRWASSWATSVTGVEPNEEMRAVALSHPVPGVRYREAFASDTGLDGGSVDVVLVVQAMHWMEPESTLAEVARILRPGGALAVIDADWPPVTGVVEAERAWTQMHRRMRILEARLARGSTRAELRRPIDDDDPDGIDDDLTDPHRNRLLADGLRSWSKSEHLDRMESSGWFHFTREVVAHETVEGGADRFVALMYSQGSYRGLRRAGLGDHDIGADEFERTVRSAFSRAASERQLTFSWRLRLGVTPPTLDELREPDAP